MLLSTRLALFLGLALPLLQTAAKADDCKERVKAAYLNYEGGKGDFATKARTFRKDTSGDNYEAFCASLTAARGSMREYANTLEACRHIASDGGAALDNLMPLLEKEMSKYASMSTTQRCGD